MDETHPGETLSCRTSSTHRCPAFWSFWGANLAFLAALSLGTTSAQHALVDKCLLLFLFALAAYVFSAAAVHLMARSCVLGVPCVVLESTILIWHLREEVGVPEPYWQIALAILLLSALCGLAVLRIARRTSPGDVLRPGIAAAVLFLITLSVAYHGSDVFRWHLLNHHKLLGTPAYYLLSWTDVETIRAQLWHSRSRAEITETDYAAADREGHDAGTARVCAGPNIIFLMVDTWRRDSLAAYGGDRRLMPRLNMRMDEAVVFKDVLASSSWTLPSVASYLTGQTPEEHGLIDLRYRLPENRTTLAEVLHRRGYQTAAMVTNTLVDKNRGLGQGFDFFHEMWSEDGTYRRAADLNRAFFAWLDRDDGRRRGQPLFAYLHYMDPHRPYRSGGSWSHVPSVSRRAYDAELAYLDQHLDRMIDYALNEIPGPTVVLVAADHGEEFGEHGAQNHGHNSLYSELVNVPVFLFSNSGNKKAVVEKLEVRDFFDLLVQWGCTPAFDVQSWASKKARQRRYLSLYLTGPRSLHRPNMNTLCMRSFEQDGFYFIWSAYGRTRELYDHRRDPHESFNLARSRPDLLELMEAQMEQYEMSWTSSLEPNSGLTRQEVEELKALGYL